MESLPIIEYFDILEDTPSCLFTATVLLMMRKLGLDRMKEAFRRGIVPTVAFSAHIPLHPIGFEQLLIVLTCVLDSP